MKILVIGGAGYIGSHACKALAAAGHQPVVFDNLTTGHRDFVRWGPLEVGDIRDREALLRVFEKHRPDLVMHFAALAYVGESVADPAKYYDVNVTGFATLLSAMRESGVDRIVFSSSCATYGVPDTVPIAESSAQAPINPYGYTKLVAEHMLRDYERAYGLSWAALRYFNAAGCDADGEIGESHYPETHAIPLALMSMLGQRGPFDVMGTDYPTPDGSAVRDYIHVTDLASAHVAAAEYLADDGAPVALNLGTGQGTSVLELIAAIERVSGRRMPVNHAPRRAGDPPALYAAPDKARELLGWEPVHSDMDNIISTALNWISAEQAGGAERAA
ncbi:UDP-glucose 4-epimerase GalE [Croceicoccus mobilis]|uniref:UDP-glucose 4-epimerase n=1 Tax=Croceicoccus mobilis TaxID=1703339 RepID=A0A917DTQ7_9SPHN|nr:UDP-glucose 4-epimerase GalE [Croceicoccus mobilis]GGD65795.1 UDP-glucose 4-epimerase GalE [Croceicoccus mobilis]